MNLFSTMTRVLPLLMYFSVQTLYAETADITPPPPKTTLSLHYEWFDWREFDANDRQLLKETGPRLGLQCDHHEELASLRLSSRTLIYLGTVDYDGQNQVGVPLESTSDYYGLLGEINADWPRQRGRITWSPFAGLGAHTWLRRLDNTGGFIDTGYNEWWISLYAQGGLQYIAPVAKGMWSGRAGVRYPFWNRAEYDFSLPDGTSGVSVNPGEDLGWFTDLRYMNAGYSFGIFAEVWNFKRSETATRGNLDIFQPRVEQQTIGVQVGLMF